MPPKNKDWEKVKTLYKNHTDREISEKLGIPRSTVASVARREGLTKPNPRLWSEKEKKTLLKYYEYGIAFVMDKLPRRTKWAIINKYRELINKR